MTGGRWPGPRGGRCGRCVALSMRGRAACRWPLWGALARPPMPGGVARVRVSYAAGGMLPGGAASPVSGGTIAGALWGAVQRSRRAGARCPGARVGVPRGGRPPGPRDALRGSAPPARAVRLPCRPCRPCACSCGPCGWPCRCGPAPRQPGGAGFGTGGR